MSIKPRIAYGTIGWLLWPMCRIAEEVKKLGLSGIEGFGLNELLPEDSQLESHLKSGCMAFVGAYYGASLVEPDRLDYEMEDFRKTVQQIKRLGGNIVAVGAGRVFLGRESENWRLLLIGAHRMARVAKEYGIQFAFHPHNGTMVFHKDQFARFVAETDPNLIGLIRPTLLKLEWTSVSRLQRYSRG